MGEVARADDQHTLILGHIGTLAVNPTIFDKLPCDPARDFKPVSLLAKVPSLTVVPAELPVKNLLNFIALAKAKPGRLNDGSAGNGSAGHLAMETLKMASDTFILHVSYRGTGPQLTDLLAGRLDMAAVGSPAVIPVARRDGAFAGRCGDCRVQHAGLVLRLHRRRAEAVKAGDRVGEDQAGLSLLSCWLFAACSIGGREAGEAAG